MNGADFLPVFEKYGILTVVLYFMYRIEKKLDDIAAKIEALSIVS